MIIVKNRLQKAKRMAIGTVSRGRKKIAEGKWVLEKKQSVEMSESKSDIRSFYTKNTTRKMLELKKEELSKQYHAIIDTNNKIYGVGNIKDWPKSAIEERNRISKEGHKVREKLRELDDLPIKKIEEKEKINIPEKSEDSILTDNQWKQVNTIEFKKWFKDSEVINDYNEEPLVVYHGTKKVFDIFSSQKKGIVWGDEASKKVFFFTDDKDEAGFYANKAGGDAIIETFLSIRKPMIINDATMEDATQEWLGELKKTDPKEYSFQIETKAYQNTSGINPILENMVVEAVEDRRFDGVIVELEGAESKWYLPFEPNQIKSATENKGSFNPNDSNINKSLSKSIIVVGMKQKHQKLADKHGVSLEQIEKELAMGNKVELEHTSNKMEAHKIAMEHIIEDPEYYSKLKASGLADELEKAIKIPAQKKFDLVMHEFEVGALEDSHGNLVTDRDQALAIAYSESGMSKSRIIVKSRSINNISDSSSGNSESSSDIFFGKSIIKEGNNQIPVKLPVLSDFGSISRNASSNESLRDRRLGDAELSSNFSNGETFIFKSNPFSKIPVKRSRMLSPMIGLGHKFKIGKIIIKSIPVNMMNNLRSKKLSPKMLLHNIPMLKNLGTIPNSDKSVLSSSSKSSDMSSGIRSAHRILLRKAKYNSSSNNDQAKMRAITNPNADYDRNYKLQGYRSCHGFNIAIENKKGTYRKGKDPDGKTWKTYMNFDYGRIVGTKATDSEAVDAYIGPDDTAERIYVVHQQDPFKKCYDEDKILFFFPSKESAIEGFLSQYDRPDFLGPVSEFTIPEFKSALKERRGTMLYNSPKQFRKSQIIVRDMRKAKKMAIGTESKGRKKVAEGKWVPVKKQRIKQEGLKQDKPQKMKKEDLPENVIYHTSSDKIEKITKKGTFGDVLFFSADKPYVMTAASDPITYAIDIENMEFIGSSQLFYNGDYKKLDNMIKELILYTKRAYSTEIDEEQAEELLSGNLSEYDIIEDGMEAGEYGWYIQQKQGEAAKLLGYDGAMGEDEQGLVYIIPMTGREGDLIEVEEETIKEKEKSMKKSRIIVRKRRS